MKTEKLKLSTKQDFATLSIWISKPIAKREVKKLPLGQCDQKLDALIRSSWVGYMTVFYNCCKKSEYVNN